MKTLAALKPQPLFNYFETICQVPRPSKKEEKIRQYLLDFAEQNKLEATTDKIGNVVIKKPASKGMEQAPTVILQTHMDMVCEKNSDKEFDFDNDAIETMIVDGWVKANGTTLGADCGIGIAAQLAVLTSKELKHGPIECLITVDEETGLTGAFNLQPGFLSGSVLLNLDSEDEGELFIGCAGGIDTLATFDYQQEETHENSIALKISVSGLLGGHSGDDIHKNLGNANKILNRFLWNWNEDFEIRLADFNGGNLRNAIAREAFGIITIPAGKKDDVLASFNKMAASIKDEFQFAEPKLEINCAEVELPAFVVDSDTQNKLLNAVYACPHGVLEMSSRMEGMVETSTNLASVKFTNDNKIVITTSQRSEIEGRKYYAAETVKAVFNLAGAKVRHSDGYPGWTPNPNSDILKTTVDSYKKLFGVEPVVRSIHAGLECGLFLEKYPHLDMVSFGPTIKGAHSPDERLDISTTEKFWKHLVDVLENIR
ncbi:aminoacyl-histidine dipeptidase [Draconibacterium sediminis]|uniref:Cytosol non-specific dipeptidase n=1 Tax=Draconibacterium sediminis TaxID=1544798 RepID=A0A0D8JHU6_9BACT|nr:aminoacyl-histidine dipeptidase [Draconibacterium sediminis]KJF45428.1 aminoacyl-histidine dipeptidase [Draconibacterium sediminis]